MSVENQKTKDLTPREKGELADRLIDFCLVPNRRVILERLREFSFEVENIGDTCLREIRIVYTKDGQRTVLSADCDRKGKDIVGGSAQFLPTDDALFDQEAEEPAYSFLKSILGSKD